MFSNLSYDLGESLFIGATVTREFDVQLFLAVGSGPTGAATAFRVRVDQMSADEFVVWRANVAAGDKEIDFIVLYPRNRL